MEKELKQVDSVVPAHTVPAQDLATPQSQSAIADDWRSAGISPDTGKAFSIQCTDLEMTLPQAVKLAQQNGWRLPTRAEGRYLYDHQNAGELKGAFNTQKPYWLKQQSDTSRWHQWFGEHGTQYHWLAIESKYRGNVQREWLGDEGKLPVCFVRDEPDLT